MDDCYTIDVDASRNLVSMRLAGFWSDDTMRSFLAARQAAFAQLRCPVNEHLSITDITDMKIQSQEMVTAFGALLADPATQAQRLAFVVAASLARTQLQRALAGREALCFRTAAEAKRWVFGKTSLARVA